MCIYNLQMHPLVQERYVYTTQRLEGMTKMTHLITDWIDTIPGLDLLARYGCSVLMGQSGVDSKSTITEMGDLEGLAKGININALYQEVSKIKLDHDIMKKFVFFFYLI